MGVTSLTLIISFFAQNNFGGLTTRSPGRRYGLPKMIGKDQEIAKPYRAIAIQIEPRFIPFVILARSKLCDEQQKIGKPNRAIAIKVGHKGRDIRRHIPQQNRAIR